MQSEFIVINGAREHNLRDITVNIPRNSLTVVTGLSGSGKSSLAFDTLYAEGQRRYVESLSAYARQFLDQLQKPDVDSIEGLSPAIAIEQRTAGSNPRSIVATTTEIHDYLRLLFASIGQAHCYKCGKPVGRQSAEEIVDRLAALPTRTKIVLLAPVVRGRKGRHEEVIEGLRRQGFVRLRVDGEIVEIDSVPELDRHRMHSIDAVVDRLIITPQIRTRLADSVETALRQGQGIMAAQIQSESDDAAHEKIYSEKNACVECGISFDDLKPRSFSFNSPYGACSRCSGIGTELIFDEDLLVPDDSLSLDDGAVPAWRRGGRRLIIYYKQVLRAVCKHYGIDMSKPFKDLTERQRRLLFYGSDDEQVQFGYWRGGVWRKKNKSFEGIIPNLQRRLENTDSDAVVQRLRSYMSRQHCPDCDGKRLKPEALACTISGHSIADLCALPVRDAAVFFSGLELSSQQKEIVGEVLKEIKDRLGFLCDTGLDYLTLDRESGTLSGGESQRIRLATQIGSGLTGVLYVLDEPTIGLHARDNDRLIKILKHLRDIGNTVVIVEHDEEMIRQADWVLDLGPGAGVHGGKVIFSGTVQELIAHPKSLTGRFLAGKASIHVPIKRKRPGKQWVTVIGAAANNLQKINVRFPVGLFTCVTGVSGSGKSTLVDDILKRALFRRFHGSRDKPGRHTRINGLQAIDKVVVIDQSPIGRTPRSNPATYTGAFSFIRELFAQTPAAKVRGYGPGRFSFNVKGGRCETCKGDGMLRLEMHFLPDVYVPCEHCAGKRYNSETLQIRYDDMSIADVLAMTINEALEFFKNHPPVERRLRTLAAVGLGYLTLGQSATTLSGGEAQRIKLSAELSKVATGRTLYLLDEPTTGLHFADVQKLLQVLQQLRDNGNTVIVIEHNLDVVKTADYIVDLGPEGGDGGGRLVACGSPEDICECKESYTGHFLKKSVI